MRRHLPILHTGCIAMIGMFGCAAGPQAIESDSQRQMLKLLMPGSIEIVEPFTRVKSFDDDTTPDGIELLLRAVNSLDNPGLMIAGRIHVELFEHMPASANPKGQRLEHWMIDLKTAEQQRSHWNQLTQMYEFRLAVDPAHVPPAKKYVLAVTYGSPLGEHLTDSCVVSYRSLPTHLGGSP